MKLHAGDPSTPGSRCIDGGVNFSVASGAAEGVDLCLFDDRGREIRRLAFTERHGEFWHGFLPGASAGLSYGYRVHGRYDPDDGLFFEPSRLLVDPWAGHLVGAYRQHPGHFPGEHTDTAPWTPKCVVSAPRSTTSSRRPLMHAPFIYEAHVRGLTRLHPRIPAHQRGTYAALGHPAIIDHLQRLGVDALELLPVQFHVDEPHLVARGLHNYWGYSPIGCPALHPDYAANPADPVNELADSIRALHAAGIEVILDVVFNHTAEGGIDGPVMGMRGFDPHLWYLHQGSRSQLADFTGCGNTLNVTHPVVADWIVHSLRFWCENLDVDGFRFDLATTLGRRGEGFDASSGLLARLAADPVIGACRLIAEPWDIGPHGYRLGAFGAGWQEWNDRFRDSVRGYWKGDPGAQAELGRRLHGSSDLFEASGRTPAASINFITAHDGFCLQDLVSYCHKHNLGNGEDNRDGTVHNLADNLGQEGPTDDPEVHQRRQRRKRAMLATLLLAAGSPMLLAGDELGHSQQGNNNAYCQDNELSWLEWPEDPPLTAFIGQLARLRAQRTREWTERFVHAPFDPAVSDAVPASVAWYSADGTPMSTHDWHRDDIAFALLRADGQRLEFCVFNRAATPVRFRIPAELAAFAWRIRFDSSSADGSPRGDCGIPHVPSLADHPALELEGQSVVVMDCQLQGNGNCR